jgi:hypothetical protein
MRSTLLVFATISLFIAGFTTSRADSITPESLCEKNVKIGDYHFDISSLKEKDASAEHVLSTQPGARKQEFTFNFCRKINRLDGQPDYRQCKDGTYFCERVIMTDHPDQKEPIVTEVYSVGNFDDDRLELTATAVANSQDESKAIMLMIIMKNKNYGATVELECSDTDDNPIYIGYSLQEKVAKLHWKTKAACGQKDEIKPPPADEGGDETSEGMSRWTIFFIFFFVGFCLYFGLGALYNSRTYNARGWDLLPHSDFWRDLPYLIKDLVMAVYNSFSSRRHGGYMSV